MKKSLVLSMALAATVAATGSVFAAANPFSDVPAKHWAYDAVTQLAKDGIVDGYDAKTFAGEKTMTRYEMAQVVGKAVAKADKANAADKKMIDKLATEFAAELNNLGVRVANLEKNQSAVKFGGTLELRATDTDSVNNAIPTSSNSQYRVRLNATAKVDDNTVAGVRFVNKYTKSGVGYKWNSGSFTTSGSTETNDNSFSLDRAFIATQMGAVKATLGEQTLSFGANNFVVDSNAYSFDGVRFEGKAGAINLAANYGRFQSNLDVASIEASAAQGKLSYGIGYAKFKDNSSNHAITFVGADGTDNVQLANKTIAKYLDLNAKYQFNNMVSVGGEYVKNSATDISEEKGSANYYYALFGAQTLANKGDQNIKFGFYRSDANGISRLSSFDNTKTGTDLGAYSTDAFGDGVDFKGFNVTYNYAFSKNLNGTLTYAKITDKAATTNAEDRGYKYYRAVLTAKF